MGRASKRLKEKAEAAVEIGSSAAAVGGLVSGGNPAIVGGAALGGAALGLLFGDTSGGLILPTDYICIPSWEFGALVASSTHTIISTPLVLRQGEVVFMPQPSEAQESQQATGMPIMGVGGGGDAAGDVPQQRRQPSAYNRRYARAFKQVSGKYRNKNGKWRKGGFKAASRAAHRIAGGKS